MGNIVAIGMSNTDLVCRTPRLPVAGETVAGRSFETFAGGKGANQAVAAARSGATVRFAGAVGDDTYGQDRLRDLADCGIDISAVQILEEVLSGIALIVVDDSGANQIVTVAGANERVDPEQLASQLAAFSCDVALLTWELQEQTCVDALNSLRSDTRVVLNTAPYGPSILQIFPDGRLIVVANEVEAGQMLGRRVSEADAPDAAREVQSWGCEAVIITLGATGAVWADSARASSVPSPQVDVVDTTGAGDAFCGAFAAWLADGASIEDSVLAGVHAGACAVTRAGAQPSLPMKDEIERSMRTAGGQD